MPAPRFDDVPIAVRLFIAPAVGLLALVVVAVGAGRIIDTLNATTSTIVNTRFNGTADVLSASSELNGAVKDLYYELASAAAGGDTQKAAAQLDAVAGRIGTAEALVKKAAERIQEPDLRDGLTAVAGELAKFPQPIGFVKDMMGVDAQAAISFLTPLRQNLGRVEERLNTAADRQRRQAAADIEAMGRESESVRTTAMATLALVILVVAAVSWLVGSAFRRSIMRITDATQALAAGDFSVKLEALFRKDELGTIVQALEVFRSSLIEREQLTLHQREAEEQARQERRDAAHRIADSLQAQVQSLVDRLNTAVKALDANAQRLGTQAEKGLQQTDAVGRAMQQADANVQAVAGAAEELSNSFQEINGQVTKAAAVAASARDKSNQAADQMARLSDQADQIGDVVRMISGIAGQTNLLALNATIEAARAGEMGKGFAVVASEVKALATQTAKATDEIGQQIAAMQAVAQDAVGAVDEIRRIVEEVSSISTAIAGAVEEQEAATREIACNVQQASADTRAAADYLAVLRQVAEVTGASSGDVLASSNVLGQEAQSLHANVGEAIASLRAT